MTESEQMRIDPTGKSAAQIHAVADCLFAIEAEKYAGQRECDVAKVLGLQPDRHNEEHQCCEFKLRKYCGVSHHHRSHAARCGIRDRCCRHQEQMTELASDCAAEIKIKELTLPKDRFEVATKQVKNQHVSEQMPWTGVQKHCGNELPCVGVANARVAERQKRPDESRAGSVNYHLRRKNDQVDADERQQGNSLALRPSPRVGRRFSAGQAHCVEDTANGFPLSL